ncbi:bifunctional diguanylate cyclase/phosphodiesterase [Psychromonas algicola]|uniref:bifunctional diguanylate cyclase/phosphodiesterase n=1 Tax=Psychromonas algicola TaxID=2555642 RepID=UPI0010681B47|nr:EAL domain-containing protein [Psychromonas sp. RZ5]TEW43555.1 phosphodiesterase [Psychromonas sp. RZ5]
MNVLNKKTWFIYYCLIAIGFLLLIINVNSKYNELLAEKKHEQFYITKIIKADIDATLSKYETMIDLINEDFNEDSSLNQTILRNILQKSELLGGFALYNMDGKLLAKSDNLSDELYNIKSSTYFDSKTLQSDTLTISKPTFSPLTNRWIIPIRQHLINPNGEVIGYMGASINIKKLEEKWSHSKAFNNNIELTLDNSFYRLMYTGVTPGDEEATYKTPLSATQINNIEIQLKKQNLSLDFLRSTDSVGQIILPTEDGDMLHSIAYDNNYHFWTHSSRPLNGLATPLLHATGYYMLLLILLLTIGFFLFRWIVKVEESKLYELTYKSHHDDLTGCYNRSVLPHLTDKLIKSQKNFSLLYIDLDNFKNINDSFGHEYGDLLLQEVSTRIQSNLAPLSGELIRYSGDEFILLLETNDKQTIQSFTIRLLTELAKFHSIENNSFSVTGSIGITRYPNDSRSLDTLISYAENSMAIAKKVKNQYLFFSQEVHEKLLKEAQIEQALHYAIDNNEISLVFQPQLDRRQNLYGVEALVRWRSKELGFIPPDVFIPIAEESGLMPKLGQYIMNTAMHEISTLQKQLEVDFALSINVSVRQFVQVNFFDLLMASINNFGSESLKVTVEITESLFIESLDVLLPIFEKMKSNNISLALDDFGTGYSSLSMLKDAPIDELKIDKSFVDQISTNKKDQAMVKSIIGIGKNLDMRVLAEGVETIEHVKILENAGCDLFQGYHFSHPLSIYQLYEFIKDLQKV